MLKRICSFLMIVGMLSCVYAQPSKQSPIPDPIMKKPAPANVNRQATTQPPSPTFEKNKAVRAVKSPKVTKQLTSRKASFAGASYIYPPYQDAWQQVWQNGTGQISTASAGKDGYAFHGASSYSWGMGTSRCWVGFVYSPTKTGRYQIIMEAYQEGLFRVCVGAPGSEVYAYRNLGLAVEGVDVVGKTLQDVHYGTPVGEKNIGFGAWGDVGKVFYLQAGHAYWISGYSEVGGWSAGDVSAWQTTSAVTALGPFSIQYLGQ